MVFFKRRRRRKKETTLTKERRQEIKHFLFCLILKVLPVHVKDGMHMNFPYENTCFLFWYLFLFGPRNMVSKLVCVYLGMRLSGFCNLFCSPWLAPPKFLNRKRSHAFSTLMLDRSDISSISPLWDLIPWGPIKSQQTWQCSKPLTKCNWGVGLIVDLSTSH